MELSIPMVDAEPTEPAEEQAPDELETPRIDEGELTALLRVCTEDPSSLGTRDAALVALAWSAGLDASQLVRLGIASFRENGGQGTLILQRQFKTDAIPLDAQVTGTILKWLSIRGNNLGPLFYSMGAQGNVRWGQSMTETDVEQALANRRQQAGIASTG